MVGNRVRLGDGARGLRLKIGHVSSCFPPSIGGVETYVSWLCTGLAERGHTVEGVTTSRGLAPGCYEQNHGTMRVIRFPEQHHLLETPLVPRLLPYLLRQDDDLLHVHGVVP